MEADFTVLLVLMSIVGGIFSLFVIVLIFGIEVIVDYRQLLKSRNRYDK